jgi:hypothetical protein
MLEYRTTKVETEGTGELPSPAPPEKLPEHNNWQLVCSNVHYNGHRTIYWWFWQCARDPQVL